METNRKTSVRRLPSIAVLAAGALLVPLAACSSDAPPAAPTETVTAETTPTVSESAPTESAPAPSATGAETSEPASPEPTTSEPAPSPSGDGGDLATGPVEVTLQPGETAQTQYFDVTLLGREASDTATATGIQVKVCYVAAHPGANADGTTRVSSDPWRFGVYDGETQTEADVQYLPVSEFDPTDEFTPVYEEKALAVGECNEGWIGIDHGNPDLAWASVRYQPADFGDVITWDLTEG